MKLIKLLGLTAIAAVAAMAFLGVSSASAVSLCKESASESMLEEGECPNGSAYPLGTKVEAQLTTGTTAKLKAEPIGTVECKKSSVSGKTTEQKEESLIGSIETATFTECLLGGTKCTVTVEGLPFTFHLLLTGEPGPLKYHLVVLKGKAKVVCGLVLSCTFGAPSILFQLHLLGSGQWPLLVKQELNREGGSLCPSTSFWEASYDITAPTPLGAVAMK